MGAQAQGARGGGWNGGMDDIASRSTQASSGCWCHTRVCEGEGAVKFEIVLVN